MLTVGNLLWHTMMQKLVPAQMLGRASAVDWLFALCLTPLGVLVGGVLATSIGVRESFLLGGAVAAAASLVVVSPRIREPDRSGLFGRGADRSSGTSQPAGQPWAASRAVPRHRLCRPIADDAGKTS